VFKSPTSLEFIDMDNNEIRFLHPETFATLSDLKNISIASNQLESIDGRLLANNKKLEWIWFNYNKLRSIESEVFGDKKSLEYIDLEGNNCIDESFDASSFASMNTEISRKCPTYESLRNATETLSHQVDTLKAEKTNCGNEVRDQKAQFENMISELNANLT
jgi:hypothetical protein